MLVPSLLGGDGSIAILVEQGEGLLELCDLLLQRDFGHRPQRQQSNTGKCRRHTPQAKLMGTAPQSAGRPWRAIENAATARTCEPLELKLSQSRGNARLGPASFGLGLPIKGFLLSTDVHAAYSSRMKTNTAR